MISKKKLFETVRKRSDGFVSYKTQELSNNNKNSITNKKKKENHHTD